MSQVLQRQQSAVVYFQRGYIHPGLAMPVVIGVLLGAISGSKILVNTGSSQTKWAQVVASNYYYVLAVCTDKSIIGITGKI